MKTKEVTISLDIDVFDTLTTPDQEGWQDRLADALRTGLALVKPSAFVGVDGCKTGWIAVGFDKSPADARLYHCGTFAELLDILPEATFAVDMPIGLPDFIKGTGRGAEQAIRPLMGSRKSSVFSIPSRKAVENGIDYETACRIASESSNPSVKVGQQGFNLFPKIREIDALMTSEREDKIYESHPEFAFAVINGGSVMKYGKKTVEGCEERMSILFSSGFTEKFLSQKRPKGVAIDDLLDACVMALVSQRIYRGQATPFPPDFQRDARGLRVAIWA